MGFERLVRCRPPGTGARETIDLEGRIVKDGVRKALRDRQLALAELVQAIQHFRQIADSKPPTIWAANIASRSRAE
jgi:hypothetical protein